MCNDVEVERLKGRVMVLTAAELHYRNELAKVLRVARDPLPSLPDLLCMVGDLRDSVR